MSRACARCISRYRQGVLWEHCGEQTCYGSVRLARLRSWSPQVIGSRVRMSRGAKILRDPALLFAQLSRGFIRSDAILVQLKRLCDAEFLR